MQSRQFDTLLRLHDTNDKKLAANDDVDYNREILNSRIVFTPKKDAVFRIIAASFGQQGRGGYEIVVREFAECHAFGAEFQWLSSFGDQP